MKKCSKTDQPQSCMWSGPTATPSRCQVSRSFASPPLKPGMLPWGWDKQSSVVREWEFPGPPRPQSLDLPSTGQPGPGVQSAAPTSPRVLEKCQQSPSVSTKQRRELEATGAPSPPPLGLATRGWVATCLPHLRYIQGTFRAQEAKAAPRKKLNLKQTNG